MAGAFKLIARAVSYNGCAFGIRFPDLAKIAGPGTSTTGEFNLALSGMEPR
jgi:hypothetical protein